MQIHAPDFLAILNVLHQYDVEFVIVGALSAVLQGAPIMTFDLDIVHKRSDDNLRNLLQALGELDISYRHHPNKALKPDAQRLASSGHQLLSSKFGPLDLLGAIEDGLDYDDLLDQSIEMTVEGLTLSVLSLQQYVALKERSSLEKDRARLPILRETLSHINNATE